MNRRLGFPFRLECLFVDMNQNVLSSTTMAGMSPVLQPCGCSMDNANHHLDFRDLFTAAESELTRSVEHDDVKANCSDVLITSAITKCLDFNKCTQETRSGTPSFFLVANTRAMCEDLIYYSLFRLVG